MRKAAVGGLVAVVLASLLLPGSAAASGRPGPKAGAKSIEKVAVGPDAYIPQFDGAKLDLPVSARPSSARTEQAGIASAAAIGDTKDFLTIDFVGGFYFFKTFTLRGLGDHIEVWVASSDDDVSSGLDFQPGDCRNGARTVVTDEQVQYLVDSSTTTCSRSRPRRSARRPPATARRPSWVRPATTRARATTHHPDRQLPRRELLRPNNATGFILHRRASTTSPFERPVRPAGDDIDAFDWLHRTGANPPHEPVPGDLCTSAPARPFLYEGVFAHEYQHLLENYEDSVEANWINEGLADWAQTITGYVDPATPITEVGFDSHIQCFLGFSGSRRTRTPTRGRAARRTPLRSWGDQDSTTSGDPV